MALQTVQQMHGMRVAVANSASKLTSLVSHYCCPSKEAKEHHHFSYVMHALFEVSEYDINRCCSSAHGGAPALLETSSMHYIQLATCTDPVTTHGLPWLP